MRKLTTANMVLSVITIGIGYAMLVLNIVNMNKQKRLK